VEIDKRLLAAPLFSVEFEWYSKQPIRDKRVSERFKILFGLPLKRYDT
jgi:hypothetical protein